jgi:hypothetical protein
MVSWRARVARYDGSRPVAAAACDLDPGIAGVTGREIVLGDSVWSVTATAGRAVGDDAATAISVTFRLVSGELAGGQVAVELDLEGWSADSYAFLPAAVYAGHRSRSLALPYPPMLPAAERGADAPPTVTDIPRLALRPPSRVDLRSADLATPAAGFHFPATGRGLLVLFGQGTAWGDYGVTLEERAGGATLTLAAPAVRPSAYAMCTTAAPSPDRGADCRAGDAVTIESRVIEFACAGVTDLFRRFARVRQVLAGPAAPVRHPVPLSHARDLVEAKYNARNWLDEGFYRTSEAAHGIEFQLGWCGGGMDTLALLADGDTTSQVRAMDNLGFIFGRLAAPTSLFYGGYSHGRLVGDDFSHPERAGLVLLRKNADWLYFGLRQLGFLDWRGVPYPAHWRDRLERTADAFVTLWRTHGQLGQFADADSGVIEIGGSAGAGIAPAGLALAAAYCGRPDLLEAAAAIARSYHAAFTAAGVTTGGPGEILQCPDSESCFGLLESFTVLAEATGDRAFVAMSEDAAAQAASWVVGYDYAFPAGSTFARLGLATRGAVWANAQNKHAAPGICTLSGSSLLKLFRLTGDRTWLDLLADITRCLPQYVSRPDRPIPVVWDGTPAGANEAGWMSERINLSDWEGPANVGEIPYGSGEWPEAALLLTYAEVPGVYVQPDSGLVQVFDQVEATLDGPWLEVANPTRYPARVKVFAETADSVTEPLGDSLLTRLTAVELAPGASRRLALGPEITMAPCPRARR